MKKRSNFIPDYKIIEFVENPKRENIFDLYVSSDTFSKFKYFRIENPIQSYLIDKGVKFVCESWENGVKILHTGLIPINNNGFYLGDYTEIIRGNKNTSLIIFEILQNKIKLYFFNSFNKKSLKMKIEFAKNFIKNKRG